MIWTAPTIAALALAVSAASALGGWKVATWRCEADKTASLERAIQQAQAQARQDQEILTWAAAQETKTRTLYRTLTIEVDRYVETHPTAGPCLDDTGMRLWHAANAGPDTPPAPDSAMP
jgi:hypothetical protein